jgi:hypothetical protein
MGNQSSTKIFGSFETNSSPLLRLKLKKLKNALNVDSFKDGKFSRRSYKDLKRLEIHSSKLKVIEANAFKRLKEIEEIIMKCSQLDTIESKAFADLPKLKKVTLLGCNIKHAKAGAFQDLPNLHEINLKSNKLNTIEPKMFNNLKRYVYLYFSTLKTLKFHFHYHQNLKFVFKKIISI